MNKAQLLDHYSSHYTSRQEIMFKLPFSINADEFWQELLNRRKMNAVVLPLHNAIGKPYWYVMTDKMIKASELLCDEAMNQNGFDPFHSEMTSAMTLEMFFTSYVEGVQLNMQDALEYLSQDIEPSDVNEQVLYNNRQALTTMTGMLYYPIDERLTKHLSYLLTQELDGCSMEYRILGNADISLMDAGKFILPSPDIIPERMNELYSFLAQNNVHPLVKSAAAQAFILTTRPFTEGNERLARIISSMILYRSGYDYFRDISISQKIASENYRYYAVMQEILQLENDGDITCFMEYFIDLLARALIDSQREKQRRIEEKSVQHDQMLEQEKQMAHFPLVPQELEEAPAAENENETDSRILFLREYVKNNADDRSSRLADTMFAFLNRNQIDFTRQEFIIELGQSEKSGDTYLRKAINDGVIIKNRPGYYSVLCQLSAPPLAYFEKDEKSELIVLNEEISNIFDERAASKLKSMAESGIDAEVRSAKTIVHFLKSGMMQFYKKDWADFNNLSLASASADLTVLLSYGIVYRFKEDYNTYTYAIGKNNSGKKVEFLSGSQIEIREKIRSNLGNNFTVSQVAELLGIKKHSVYYHLNYLLLNEDIVPCSSENSQEYRFTDESDSLEPFSKMNLNEPCVEGKPNVYMDDYYLSACFSFLMELLSKGLKEFHFKDFLDVSGLSSRSTSTYLKKALEAKMIKRDSHNNYVITLETNNSVKNDVPADKQTEILSLLAETFKEPFSISEAFRALGVTKNVITYYIHNLVKQGYIKKCEDTHPNKYIVLHSANDDNDSVSEEFMRKLNELKTSDSEQKRRWGNTLHYFISQGKSTFINQEWVDAAQISNSTADADIKGIIWLNMIKRERNPNGGGYMYIICTRSQCNNESLLTEKQMSFFKILSDTFPDDFSVREAANTLGLKESSFIYHLKHFLQSNLIVSNGETYPSRYRVNYPQGDDEYYSQYSPEPVMAGACV